MANNKLTYTFLKDYCVPFLKSEWKNIIEGKSSINFSKGALSYSNGTFNFSYQILQPVKAAPTKKKVKRK